MTWLAPRRVELRYVMMMMMIRSPFFAKLSLIHLIQNEQRQRRKDELAAGVTWQLKHFAKTDGADCEKLLLRPE